VVELVATPINIGVTSKAKVLINKKNHQTPWWWNW
jgi:hypothetical protein